MEFASTWRPSRRGRKAKLTNVWLTRSLRSAMPAAIPYTKHRRPVASRRSGLLGQKCAAPAGKLTFRTGTPRAAQTNALLGLTRKLTPNFLFGVFGGYENFDYTSQLFNGELKGNGWTVGGYLGWRILSDLRFDAGVARSGISYDGVAGSAAATFPAQPWVPTVGPTGSDNIRH